MHAAARLAKPCRRPYLRRGVAVVIGSLALASTAARPASADPRTLFGDVGGAPAFMTFDEDGASVNGFYYYTAYAAGIRVGGTIEDGHVHLDEFGGARSSKSASFDGRLDADVFSGTWTSARGVSKPFAFRQDRAALSHLSGRYHCTDRYTTQGITFSSDLGLTIADGTLTRLEVSQEANHGENACYIALSDLHRVPSEAGIALRANEDVDSDPDDFNRHCGLSIVGSARYVLVQFQGCRGAGDSTRFCSARGGWSDVLLDRKTGACRMTR